jgi:ATP-dependent protease Clp ATPase subunit
MFDEFDKLVFNRVLEYGSCVTGQLLRLIDGDTLPVEGRVTLSTHRMLFILAGAWTALRDTRTAEANQAPFGFAISAASQAPGPQHLDLASLELPAELGGRVTHFVALEPHTTASLRALIASEYGGPLVSLRQHAWRWRSRLTVTGEAMDLLANFAAQSPFGARALNNLVQQLTDAVLWQWQPGSLATDIVIDVEVVRQVCLPGKQARTNGRA